MHIPLAALALFAACDQEVETLKAHNAGDTDALGAWQPGDSGDPNEICPRYVDAAAGSGGMGSQDDPHAAIGQALQELRTCREVIVLPGTYQENVDFDGRLLYLHSQEGAEQTIIEPSGGTVVRFDSSETDKAILEGFTLRGGTGTIGVKGQLDEDLEHGGGVLAIHASPTIRNCIIEDNAVTGRGAGAVLYDFGGLFTGNTVRDNSILGGQNYGGAGIYLYDSLGEVSDNLIQGNYNGATSGDGGGIMIYRGAALVARNTIEDNYAAGTGGGIRSADADSSLFNNLVIDNTPDGITLSYDDAGLLINNTIAGNLEHGLRAWADEDYYKGETGPTTVAINNIIADHGRYGFYVTGYNAMSEWYCNDVYGSGTANYHDHPDETGEDGNLSVDPGFAEGGYSLGEASDLIDVGQDVSKYGVSDDILGQARPLGEGYDIGAYESY